MKYTAFILMCFLSFSAVAQQYTDEPPKKKEKKEMKSLISKSKDITGFGNFDFRVGQFAEKEALVLGGYGGMLINRSFMLGIGAYGIATDVEFDSFIPDPNSATPTTMKLNGGYAGILLGAKIATKEILHLSIPVLVGMGQVDVTDPGYFNTPNGDNDYIVETSNYFMVEPGLMLEINISQHFRLNLGGSLRIAQGLDTQYLAEEDISGFSGVIGFQFGNF